MNRILSALSLLVVALSCSGCAHLEQNIKLAASDPSYLPAAYASVSITLIILLLIFTDRGLWRCLIDTIKYVAILSLVVAPLYWVSTENWKAGVAMGLSGLAGFLVVYLAFPQYRTPPKKKEEDE